VWEALPKCKATPDLRRLRLHHHLLLLAVLIIYAHTTDEH
jgi:hypothetical protein